MEKEEKTNEVIKESAECARKISESVNQAVRDNPWPYLAGAAVFSFLLGFLMSNARRD